MIVRPDNWEAFEGSVIFFMPADDGYSLSRTDIARRHQPTGIRIEPPRTAQDLPIGGAVCFFNPTYGRGMSAAASDFGNSKCTGDFPVDDLPDLERLGRLAI